MEHVSEVWVLLEVRQQNRDQLLDSDCIAIVAQQGLAMRRN
jgi:hypothetical protein